MAARAKIWFSCLFLVSSAALAQQPPTIQVSVVPAEKTALADTTRFVGRIEAIERVDVRARVTGFLEKVEFKDGDRVKQGTPLYQIEKGPFEAAVQQARAAVDKTRALLENANIQKRRADELIKTSAISQATRDDRTASAREAEGNFAAAEADLKTAEINLAYTDITSPIDGRIGRTAVTRGNVVGPNSGVLTTIVSSDPMYVVFPVSQREFLRLKEEGRGTRKQSAKDFNVNIQFSNGAAYGEKGQIDFVDVKVDRATDAVTVRAKIANPNGELVDGQLVHVAVESGKPEERVVVPQAALIADQLGTYVFAIEDGKAVVKRLRLGPTKGGSVVVLEGLTGGEMVVVQGVQGLRQGAAVTASPAQPPVRGL
ncbi:efflux RND transporter periplasmic adaptor subunit [Nitrobacter sp. TKz-YC02]|uniref:efflux RND transporter periplasmic adaptor subunit n=1 Tax=Nitrobacter sp. TKz-YC02 TaxID=3398704 RepID=UPI003CF976D8